MTRLILILAALAGVTFVTGCGQSGPLYLPGDPSEVRRAPLPAEQEAEDGEEEADESR
jgi:predicted small lipoprotein YifL